MYGPAMSRREEKRAAANRGAYVAAPQVSQAPVFAPVQPEPVPQQNIPEGNSVSGYTFQPEPAYLQQAAYEQQQENAPEWGSAYQNPGQTPVPPQVQRAPYAPVRKHEWLQILMTFVLPALFVLCFVLLIVLKTPNTWLFGALFLVCAAACVVLMWGLGAFKPSSRSTLTAVYAACATVMLVAILFSVLPDAKDTSAASAPVRTATERTRQGTTVQSATDTPAQQIDTSGQVSAAEQRLQAFVGYWGKKQYDKCLELCLPNWVINQNDATKSIFNMVSDVTPLCIAQVEKIDGTEADTSRTITVLLRVKDYFDQEVYRRYNILMLKVNKVWYIDPASLSGSVTVAIEEVADKNLTVLITPSPSPTPKATTSPDKVLYYNPDGGEYYHVSKDCSSMNSAAQRKLKPFTYKELNNPAYSGLKRCPKCGAPARPE